MISKNKDNKISIIILTYNNLEYTKLCISSIRKYTSKNIYEMIVVDNNSTDGTSEGLKQQKDVKTILNKENLGFPKGCNQGIELASGNDVLLLNNDTIPTPNWIENLQKCLYSSKNIGAVGAVTNACSNDQVIVGNYKNIEEMIRFAKINNISNPKRWEERLRLIGYCMLIKKEVIEKVGLLDEIFTPGNFEDDDYCFRIRKAGYRLMLCKDAFIHHFGNISFGKEKNKFEDLLVLNREKFKDKWKIDPYYITDSRKDITELIKKYYKEDINILEIGCGGGATLLDIKNTMQSAKLYGIEEKKEVVINTNHFAHIKIGTIEEVNEYEKYFFDYIIISTIEMSVDNLIERLWNIKEYLNNNGNCIVTLSKNIEENEESIKNKIENIFKEFYCGLYETNKDKIIYLINKNNIERLSGFEFDIENNVYVDSNCTPINYADGSEEYLINVFKEEEDIDEYSYNLSKYIKDWGSQYHLTNMRTTLLESVKEIIPKDCDALELGAGMGALTPWLGSNFKSVDAIEGSLNRAKALRLRTKNKSNVRVLVTDLLNMKYPKENYGFISLTGVMEYLPYYAQSDEPKDTCIDFLKEVNEGLDDEGVLMISIENKLGAKYFAGCSEDHNNKIFSGINGYPEKSPITFSRNELEEIIQKAGFENIQFYHLFPDYKLPKVIIKEDEEIYNLKISGIVRGLFRDYSGHREYFMPDSLLVETMTKAKLLFHTSNSFLVLCSKSKNINLKSDWLIRKFWNNDSTKPILHHKIEFIKKEDEFIVKREPIANGIERARIGNVSYNLTKEMKVVDGDPLIIEAYKSILKQDAYKSLIHIVEEVRNNLIEKFGIDKYDLEEYRFINGEAIDYCFHNLIKTKNNTIHFIDTKWAYEEKIPEDFIIFRSLLGLFCEMNPFIKEFKLSDFICECMKKIYPNYNMSRFNKNLELESKFQSCITRQPVKYTDVITTLNSKSYEMKN